MDLQIRIELAARLGEYILENNDDWQDQKERAYRANPWFVPEFVELATKQVAVSFLEKNALQEWAKKYELPAQNPAPKKVGIVMAGNIPLVGFHDFLAVFISGHIAAIKLSAKDSILIKHLVGKMIEWNSEVEALVEFGEMLKGCDAYIATGSNNTGRYFEYYFAKYPHIIRKNRTSVAVLTGKETIPELEKLSDDIMLYFGMGCRNVTKLYVPENYDFVPLLATLKKHEALLDYHKYKHNYGYHLTLLIMNMRLYMNNGFVVLAESKTLFPPISQVYYEFYKDGDILKAELAGNNEVQCIVGKGFTGFGQAQYPSLNEYADGIDTMEFLKKITNG